jgi:glycosyltransferase involved in cell wall biosynthesis
LESNLRKRHAYGQPLVRRSIEARSVNLRKTVSTSPIVSVCVASYNHARFLPAMLDGILSQTFRDFEIVAVDDGSTDNSLEVLQDYAHRNPEIMRVYTHPGVRNLGISATCNLGFEKSRGKYWCPHASDDISYPDRLERQVAFLESYPDVGWVYGTADLIDENGALLGVQAGSDLSSCTDLVENFIWENPIVAPTTMIRRDCALRIGPFDEAVLYSDWEYWIRLAAHYLPAFVSGPVVKYRVHPRNTSLGIPRKGQLDRHFQVMKAVRQKTELTGGLLDRPQTKAQLDFCKANLCFQIGDFESGRREVRNMFESDPTLRFNPTPIAQWLRGQPGRRLALAVVQEFGSPPRWAANMSFVRTLLHIFLYRPLQHTRLFNRQHPANPERVER